MEWGACEVLIIGTGANGGMKVDPEVKAWLDELAVQWESHPTGTACERYNALVREGKKVIAALHLTC